MRLSCGPPLHSVCVWAAELRGLSNLMLDMAVAPELVHRLMAHLRDGITVDAPGGGYRLLTPNNIGGMFCSDPVGPDPGDGP